MPDAIPQPSMADTPAPPPPPPPDLTGRTLGDYQLLRRLGTGGMGQVYLARQLSLKREVALKLLRDELLTNDTARKRFQAEAEAVAKLNHTNIVHIHQLGEHDGQRYMVLEYVEGRNLRDHLARKGPPDLPITLSVIRQVALALQNAHDQGIVHRDIKPENILVTRKVEVKVADFGLSRFFAGPTPALNLTQSGVTLGTPLYMSPEQVQGKPVDHRSDVLLPRRDVLPHAGRRAAVPRRDRVRRGAEARPGAAAAAFRPAPGPPRGPLRDGSQDDGEEPGRPVPVGARNPPRPGEGARRNRRWAAPDERPYGAAARADPFRDEYARTGGAEWRGPHNRAADPLGSLGLRGAGGPRRGRRRRLTYLNRNPLPERLPIRCRETPPPAVGLPDIRSPEKLVTTRERELLALLGSRETKSEDMITGYIELGLLYLKERRLDDAEASFKKLEGETFRKETLAGPQSPARTAGMAGRLGQAVVLAYRETPNAAQQSNDLVMKVLSEPFAKVPGKFDKVEKGYQAVVAFLLRHADLAQAVSDALNRNAVALGKAKLEPNALEQLRSPPKAAKKD